MSVIKLAGIVYLLFGLVILFGWWLSGAPFQRGESALLAFWVWGMLGFWITAILSNCLESAGHGP